VRRLAFILLAVSLCLSQQSSAFWQSRDSNYNGNVFATYYIATTGNDSNAGTSGSPWLTPNHAINCGDTILAAAGTYSSGNFANGKWGTVSNCPSPAGVYFARLSCVGPYLQSCAINDTASNATRVDASNWAVVGWTVSSTVGACFYATPSTTANLHHIAFINSYAKNCKNSGYQFAPYYANMAYGIDQSAIVGAIAYNGAAGGSECFSGASIYEPKNVGATSGTHIFLAGVFSISNLDPVTGCPGNSDGEGVIFDDWASQQSTGIAYTSQGVLEQSMMLGNGSAGVEVFSTTSAPIMIKSTTAYGDYQSTVHAGTYNGEGLINSGHYSTWTGNIFQASLQTQNGNNVYGFLVGTGMFTADATNTVSGNYIFGVSGLNTSNQGSGFTFGSNTLATPDFVSPTVPSSAPDCSAAATTTACMATVIANFVAQASGAASLGYQAPGSCTADAYWPTWLNGVVPVGLITQPCGTN
jgi:hypothetical protein